MKQLNFSKSENIGKGFAILAQLIVLSQIAGTTVLKKALSKSKLIAHALVMNRQEIDKLKKSLSSEIKRATRKN